MPLIPRRLEQKGLLHHNRQNVLSNKGFEALRTIQQT
jgi:hypothetical protein